LPLGQKTACAWLMATHFPSSKTNPEDIASKAVSAARQAYEGGYNGPGERTTSSSLERAFPEFDDLWTDLPDWAQRVYGPMLQVLMPSVNAINNKVDA
jgi:hypothetical protein